MQSLMCGQADSMAKAAEAGADHVDSAPGAAQQRQQVPQPGEAADSARCQVAAAIRDLPHELELIRLLVAFHGYAHAREQYVSHYQQLAMRMHFRRFVCSEGSGAILDQLVDDLGKDACNTIKWDGLFSAMLHSLRSVPESVASDVQIVQQNFLEDRLPAARSPAWSCEELLHLILDSAAEDTEISLRIRAVLECQNEKQVRLGSSFV